MMRFLIDENIRKEVIDFLKLERHDVHIVSRGSKDKDIAQIAKETKRIILTHDNDFTDPVQYPSHEYAGIIRIKIHPPSTQTIINALKRFLSSVGAKELDKKLVILEREGFRIR